MSIPRKPKPAKLLIGLFLKDKRLTESILPELIERCGPVDLVSPWLDFDYTSYYEAEMGGPLYRRVFVFKRLIRQPELVDIKLFTNGLENEYADDGKRRVNIDPGFLLGERLVLATGKNFAHRIYLSEGIYADLTLIFKKTRYRKLPWTYPDYGSETIVDFLSKVRKKYVDDLKRYPTSY